MVFETVARFLCFSCASTVVANQLVLCSKPRRNPTSSSSDLVSSLHVESSAFFVFQLNQCCDVQGVQSGTFPSLKKVWPKEWLLTFWCFFFFFRSAVRGRPDVSISQCKTAPERPAVIITPANHALAVCLKTEKQQRCLIYKTEHSYAV